MENNSILLSRKIQFNSTRSFRSRRESKEEQLHTDGDGSGSSSSRVRFDV